MGAASFNLAPKFPQMGDFQAQISMFCKKIFGQEKLFQEAKI